MKPTAVSKFLQRGGLGEAHLHYVSDFLRTKSNVLTGTVPAFGEHSFSVATVLTTDVPKWFPQPTKNQ